MLLIRAVIYSVLAVVGFMYLAVEAVSYVLTESFINPATIILTIMYLFAYNYWSHTSDGIRWVKDMINSKIS